jgi:hypothetical protein
MKIAKNRNALITALTIMSLSLPTLATGETTAAADVISAKQQHTDTATVAHRLALLAAPIRSRHELIEYINRHRGAPTPLDALSPRGKQRFLDSLRFGTDGLASFSRTEIESQLNPTQAYRLLALFGLQHVTPQLNGMRRGGASDAAIMKSRDETIEERYVLFGFRCNQIRQTCEQHHDSICFPDSC